MAVAKPLPELLSPVEKEPPKRGGGYVELGDHVVVCSFGLEVGLDVTFFVVRTVRGILETEDGLSVTVVIGRVIVDIVVGFDCD